MSFLEARFELRQKLGQTFKLNIPDDVVAVGEEGSELMF